MEENAYIQLTNAIKRSRKKLDTEMSKEMVKIYRNAFINSYNELEKMIERSYDNGGEAVEDLILAKVEYTRQVHNQVEKLMEKYEDLQCTEYANAHMAFFESTLPYYEGSQFMKNVRDRIDVTNKRILQIMDKGGMYKDKQGLSERVWGAAEFSGNKLHDAIMSCIAQGKGPADTAKIIQQFGTTGHKIWDYNKIKEKLGPGYASKYSGGLDYAALRLARTTMTHLHQLQVIKSNEFNPYVGKVRYHSVHAANRTCNMCAERDGQIFALTKVPLDHPNGMCWLEPVFTDAKGKIMTPEQIGDDIGKWIRGEKNSGLMDKIPEYKKLPVVKTNNKPVEKPKPKEKTQQQLRQAQWDEYANIFASQVTTKEEIEYFNNLVNMIQKYPEHIQDAYMEISKHLRGMTKDSGAYYSPRYRRININVHEKIQQANRTGRGKYDVWFHESGHAMDDLLWRLCNNSPSYNKVISQDERFLKALKNDFKNQKLMIKKKYLKEAGEDVDNMTKKQINEILPNSELPSLYYHYLANDNKTAGIQDVVEGMSNCKIQVRWGHGKAYWNRGNREYEYASEAWANMLGSYSDEETYNYMMEYFPESMKVQNDLIKEYMDKYKEVNK